MEARSRRLLASLPEREAPVSLHRAETFAKAVRMTEPNQTGAVAQEPLGGDDARADQRLSLLARKHRDRGSVLIPGGRKTKAGRQAHAQSLHTVSP